MLGVSFHQTLILFFFSFFLREVLTTPTLLFVLLGSLLVFFGIKTKRFIRNILSLVVFGSYWLKYGKVIDPEVGINFLTSIIVLKNLEKESLRDRYMIFFGLILLISSGSLFEKSISYVIFFSISFFILLQDFYQEIGQKFKMKKLIFSLIWVFPLTVVFFFLMPRMINPIPFQQNTSTPGEIGHTPDVIISEIDSLESNPEVAFRVATSRELIQSELYWRGNTLSYNDGWNWRVMPQDEEKLKTQLDGKNNQKFNPDSVKQSFSLSSKTDYFFTLDIPSAVKTERGLIEFEGSMKTLSQKKWNLIQRYEAWSTPKGEANDQDIPSHYLKVPISKREKESLGKNFSGQNLDELVSSIKNYYRTNQFTYSLKPGKIKSLNDFLEKKIGFCSHYASSLAIILRLKGIPTRLVSGFMGGAWNKYANFYLVTQNDAHVWVEAFYKGKWKRLDPVEWISPDRVLLGGSAFVESIQGGVLRRNKFLGFPAFLNNLRLWFNQWDFLFYQWLETMDYQAQEEWFRALKLRREWMLSVIPLLIALFMTIYLLFLKLRPEKSEKNRYQKLWNLFFKKMKKKGVLLSSVSLRASEEQIAEKMPEQLPLWRELIGLTFREKRKDPSIEREIKKTLKKIKKIK